LTRAALINHAKEDGKGFWKWLSNSTLKTRDEVLYSALKKHGISTVKDGKALKYSELLKLLPKEDKLTRVKLRNLNIAQIAGYTYSALVLGLGIPKLNDYMTKKNEAKRLARLAAEEQSQAADAGQNQAQPEINTEKFMIKGKFLG